MANKSAYQTTFEVENTIQPIYTGGSVSLDQSGRILATTLGEDALLTDLNSGRQLAKIEGVSQSQLSLLNWAVILTFSQDGETISTLTRKCHCCVPFLVSTDTASDPICVASDHMLSVTIYANIFTQTVPYVFVCY